MKKILIHYPAFAQNKLFDPFARDNWLEPFIYLRNKLTEIGYQLETADDHPVEDCESVWFWDVPEASQSPDTLRSLVRIIKNKLLGKPAVLQRDLYQDCFRAGIRDKLALFIFEPPVYYPQNWDPQMHDLFSVIFTWNDSYVDGKKFFKFREPITSQFPEVSQVPFEAKKLLVNISGNKFSTHLNELYSARREAIRHFERSRPDGFDLYGVGWDDPSTIDAGYSSYRGTVQHKWDVYPYYRFGLCYENMRDAPGCISEKIFDCMRANCVPIYWGAPNISDYVDADAFIDRTRFQSNAELDRFLIDMSKSEYMRYQQAIKDYLMSDRFAAFLSPAFADTIIRTLRL